VDRDGDKIGVSSQIEWEELISELSESGYKIFIEAEKKESNGCCFGGSSDSNGEEEKESNDCPIRNIFEAFCPIIRILGFPIQNGVGVRCYPCGEESNGCCFGGSNGCNEERKVSNDCPFGERWGSNGCRDEDKEGCNRNPFLLWKLHKIAYQYLESGDKIFIQKGKETLQKILDISPNDKIALYNLACADSLLGNLNEAITALNRAIDAGYNDLFHMLNDKDFDNIKNTDEFHNLVAKLESILFPNEKKDETSNLEKPSNQEKNENKVEPSNTDKPENKEEKKSLIEVKLDTLGEIFPFLPREILKDLLIQCKERIEEVVETISKSSN